MVIVMTHSHPLDFDITAAALQRDAFDFVGLIGSETKRARFASWARQVGVAESRIDWLVCPIGMPQIRGKEPAVIAAGIAAQLLIARERASAPLVSPATPAGVSVAAPRRQAVSARHALDLGESVRLLRGRHERSPRCRCGCSRCDVVASELERARHGAVVLVHVTAEVSRIVGIDGDEKALVHHLPQRVAARDRR